MTTGTYTEVCQRDAVCSVEYKDFRRQCTRARLSQFGSQQQAGGPQKLDLALADRANAEEPVHERHSQREHVLLASLLFTYLQAKTHISLSKRFLLKT